MPELSPIAEDAAPEPPVVGAAAVAPPPIRELGGPTGLEPTRYGDWEKSGRCIDF
jgi:hypothetical protein